MAARLHSHDHGFRLIPGMVAKQQVEDAGFGAGRFQRVVTGGARAFRQAGSAVEAVQRENAHRDATRAEAVERAPRLVGGRRPQPVIDDQRGDASAARAGPPIGEQRERETVGTTRGGDGQMRRRLERTQRIEVDGEGRREGAGNVRQWQLARARAEAIVSRSSGFGVGNAARSFSSASQDATLSFSAFSEIARPSSDSWAWDPPGLRW